MATRMSIASGNFSSAASWAVVDSTSLLMPTVTSSTLTTLYSDTRSSAFTPGAITIDGIAVWLASRLGTTGTMSVSLFNQTDTIDVVGTEQTINCSDLPITPGGIVFSGGWVLFKFGGPVLLTAGKSYKVQAKTSSSSQVSLHTDATVDNLARCLRTTTTGAPVAGDNLIICGEKTGIGSSNNFTVTMDNTASTDFGGAVLSQLDPALAICQGGTLTYGTTAATNFVLRLSGYAVVTSGGTLNIGTVATPLPRDGSAVLEFDCPSDGAFGLQLRPGFTCTMQGLSRTSGKNIVDALLNTDVTAAATIIGVDTDTGWLSGDVVGIASTTRTFTQCESRILNGNAGASSFTVTSGLTNAHSGTSPTQGEVILLTRNVKVRSVSSSFMAFVSIATTGVADFDWVEFSNLGENAAGKRGIEISTTTGDCNIQFCSVYDCEDWGIFITGTTANNIVVSNNVTFNLNSSDTASQYAFRVENATTGTALTVSDNIFMLNSGGGAMNLADLGGTISNNTVAGADAAGIIPGESGATGTFSGNTIHSCLAAGLSSTTAFSNFTFTNLTIWRCTTNGVSFSLGSNNLIFDTATLFGNGVSNISFSSLVGGITLKNVTSNSDTSFPTTSGLAISIAGTYPDFVLEDCDFSTVSGIKTAHTNDINIANSVNQNVIQLHAENCKFGGTNEMSNQTGMGALSIFTSQRHEQVAGSHKTLKQYGTLQTDATTFNTAAPSEKMTPNNANKKLKSGSKIVPVASGSTVTVNWYVQKDGTYNGNAPRLIVLRNVAAGISADTVLNTHTAAISTWEQLTGTTDPVTDDTALEFVIDCDGTAGNVFNDDFTATVS